MGLVRCGSRARLQYRSPWEFMVSAEDIRRRVHVVATCHTRSRYDGTHVLHKDLLLISQRGST